MTVQEAGRRLDDEKKIEAITDILRMAPIDCYEGPYRQQLFTSILNGMIYAEVIREYRSLIAIEDKLSVQICLPHRIECISIEVNLHSTNDNEYYFDRLPKW